MASVHEERRGSDAGTSDLGARPEIAGTFGPRGEPVASARGSRYGEARGRREIFPRVVTVSREFGAGGGRIAALLAEQLGFQLWDQELVAHLARKVGADPSLMRELDERRRDLFDDAISTALYGVWVSGSKYRTLLARVIGELAERGGAVIVGRGANFLVQAEQALRVRVVCPFRARVERYARMGRVDWARAERLVRSKDRERERFARQLCAESAADPSHYDLIVNTGDLTEEDATRLIAAAYQARFASTSTSPRTDSVEPSFRL